MRLGDVPTIVITLVILGITLGIALELLDSLQVSLGAGIGGGAVNNTTRGLGEIGGWMPTIGLAIAASIVIGVVAAAFMRFA